MSCFIVPWQKVQEDGERRGRKFYLVQIRASNMVLSETLAEALTAANTACVAQYFLPSFPFPFPTFVYLFYSGIYIEPPQVALVGLDLNL